MIYRHPNIHFLGIACIIALFCACSNHPPHQYTRLDLNLKNETLKLTKENHLPQTRFINTIYTGSAIYGHPPVHLNEYYLSSGLHAPIAHPWVFSTGYQDPRFQLNQADQYHPVSSSYRLNELLLLLKAIGKITSSQTQRPDNIDQSGQISNGSFEEGDELYGGVTQSSCQKSLHGKRQCESTQSSLFSILLKEYSNTNFFESNSSVIRPNRLDAIIQLAGFIAKQENLQIEIRGHTDNTASDNHNQRLSIMRAKSIADRMMEQGVTKSQIYLFGFGKTKPVCSNGNAVGKALNRRTEIYALGVSSDYFVHSCNFAAANIH